MHGTLRLPRQARQLLMCDPLPGVHSFKPRHPFCTPSSYNKHATAPALQLTCASLLLLPCSEREKLLGMSGISFLVVFMLTRCTELRLRHRCCRASDSLIAPAAHKSIQSQQLQRRVASWLIDWAWLTAVALHGHVHVPRGVVKLLPLALAGTMTLSFSPTACLLVLGQRCVPAAPCHPASCALYAAWPTCCSAL